jgi:gluconolactonase
MKQIILHSPFAILLVAYATGSLSAQPTGSNWLGGKPEATVDLTSADHAIVDAKWSVMNAEAGRVSSRGIGADLKPTGDVVSTLELRPSPADKDFEMAGWRSIRPPQPSDRFGNGRVSFVWMRLQLTFPETIAGFNVNSSRAVLEIVVDDYAEIWVNGKLQAPVNGQTGGSTIAGWNAPNRVILSKNARAGDRFDVAILGINGPLSTSPENFVWLRSASLDFYSPASDNAATIDVSIESLDPAMDEIFGQKPQVCRLASGFTFTEGPIWAPNIGAEPGSLLFSDPNENTIYRLDAEGGLSEYRVKSGYAGTDIGRYRQPGSNGLALDAMGRLTICQHGNRQILRVEKNGTMTVMASHFEGKRLNSPNDLTYRSDDTLFFTDPPFGLPGFHADPGKETPFSGVYCLRNGNLKLIDAHLSGPNGIALSPDERYLYVGNWDDSHKVLMRYEIDGDGNVVDRRRFFDLTSLAGEEGIDGIKTDSAGRVFVSGPGGLSVFSPDGKRLGLVRLPEHPHNLVFGGPDRRTLFLTCVSGVYQMRLFGDEMP